MSLSVGHKDLRNNQYQTREYRRHQPRSACNVEKLVKIRDAQSHMVRPRDTSRMASCNTDSASKS
jgi:hypothetical protein